MFQVSWKYRSLVVAGTVALALILAGCGGAGAGGGGASGGDSGSGTPADTTPPAPVTALSTAAGDGSVTLSWSDPSDGDLAEILITWEPGGAAAQSVAPGNGSYTATGLSNGTAYTFTVVAVDASGNVSSGVEATATPQAPNLNAPAEVSSLQASPGDGQVTLTWSDPGDSDLDRIEIRWNPGGSTWQSVSAGTESYTATGLTNGQSYTFTLRTVDEAGNASAGVTTTTETPFTGNLLTEFDQLGVEFRDYDSDSGWAVVINILGDQPDIASLMPAADPSLGTLSGVRFVSFVIRKSGLTQELPTGTFPVRPDNDASGNAFSANFVLGLSLDFANDAYLGSEHDGSTSQDPFWSGQSWDYEIEGGEVEISQSGSNYTIDFSFDLATGNTVTGSFTGPVDLSIEADPPDLTPPDAPTGIDLAASSDSGVSSADDITNITAGLRFDGNAEANAEVEVTSDVDGVLGTATADSDGSWSLAATSTLSEGPHSITATAKDASGNVSDASQPLLLVVDTTPPIISDFTINSDVSTPSDTNSLSAFLYPDLDSDAAQVQFRNAGESWTAWTAAGNSFSHTLSSTIGEGVQTVEVRARDVAGNVRSASESIEVDFLPTASRITIRDLSFGATLATDDIDVRVSTIGAQHVTQMQVRHDGATSTWLTFQPNYEYRMSASAGEKVIEVRLRDAQGNVTGWYTDAIRYNPNFNNIDAAEIAASVRSTSPIKLFDNLDEFNNSGDPQLSDNTIILFVTGSGNRGKMQISGSSFTSGIGPRVSYNPLVIYSRTGSVIRTGTGFLQLANSATTPNCYDFDDGGDSTSCSIYAAADAMIAPAPFSAAIRLEPMNGASFVVYYEP